MLAIGAGLLIIAVAVFLDAPQNIYGIEELWFSIGAGFISVILILIGLGLVFSKYTDVPPDEPGEE
jgi:uncharacterized membrane protein AbrB (regulator of aidB expression)